MKEIKTKEQEQQREFLDNPENISQQNYITLKRSKDLSDPLSELDLDAYAQRLRKENKGKKF